MSPSTIISGAYPNALNAEGEPKFIAAPGEPVEVKRLQLAGGERGCNRRLLRRRRRADRAQRYFAAAAVSSSKRTRGGYEFPTPAPEAIRSDVESVR
jgi:hypothetical protein